MNNKFSNAIASALDEEYADMIPKYECDHIFSDEFNKKLDKLVKRQRKPYYKFISTTARRAACIIVAVLIASFSTVMGVGALRSAFKEFFMSIFSDHSNVTADVSDDSYSDAIDELYEISYDLSDYSIILDDRSDFSRHVIYEKGNGTIIDFQQWTKDMFNVSVNTEGAKITAKDVAEKESISFIDNRGFNYYIWDNGEYIIMINSNISKNELKTIAESVQKVEK